MKLRNLNPLGFHCGMMLVPKSVTTHDQPSGVDVLVICWSGGKPRVISYDFSAFRVVAICHQNCEYALKITCNNVIIPRSNFGFDKNIIVYLKICRNEIQERYG